MLVLLFAMLGPVAGDGSRATGDLGVVIERAAGSILVVEHSHDTRLHEIEGLGDLSHASVVFSRDARYAFVFGRDGGLTKVDLLSARVVKRIVQSGNSIGGAISQDGKLVAVSNYEPGGVRVFDSQTLAPVADIRADYGGAQPSKVVGLVDAPGKRFVFSLYDADQIWIADFSAGDEPSITRFSDVGHLPYDALITPDGRHYVAGLFGEDHLALLDLWHPQRGVHPILDGYSRREARLPVYKMPHLEGWAVAGGKAFVPAVGQHKVLVVDTGSWKTLAEIEVHGQPVFVMARPDGRQLWVNYAYPDNDTVQVIDAESYAIVRTLKPGKAVLHMEFTPRGEKIWLSVRDDNRIQVYDTATLKLLRELPADKPSGIFFTSRAHRIGL